MRHTLLNKKYTYKNILKSNLEQHRLIRAKLMLISVMLPLQSIFSQPIKEFVQNYTYKIEKNEIVTDEFTDLKPFGDAIGDADIVMLGEQDHGDGATFAVKTRLIKYLHEKKGFNVLAFESDFYGLTAGWEALEKKPEPIYTFLRSNLFFYWSYSIDCQDLLKDYIPKTFTTENPLNVAGFDSQMWLDYSYRNLVKNFDQYLRSTHVMEKFEDERSYMDFIVSIESLLSSVRNNTLFTEAQKSQYDKGMHLVGDEKQIKRYSPYWQVVIKNLISSSDNTNEVRDFAMSQSLDYLVRHKYTGQKIIVWAANSHIMKYTDHLKSKKKDFEKLIFNNMSTHFTANPANNLRTYILGFTSYRGTAGRLRTEPYTLQTPFKHSVETWIPENIDYGFIDFKHYNRLYNNPSEAFFMKGPLHFTIPKNITSVPWNLVYDGVYFIRDIYATHETK